MGKQDAKPRVQMNRPANGQAGGEAAVLVVFVHVLRQRGSNLEKRTLLSSAVSIHGASLCRKYQGCAIGSVRVDCGLLRDKTKLQFLFVKEKCGSCTMAYKRNA